MSDLDHKKLGIEYFNGTWDLIGKKVWTEEDKFKAIHMTHASCFHWSFVGNETNFTRSEWQISRVYAIAGMGESSLIHAKRSLDICQKAEIADFDLAFCFEAVARAYAVLKDKENAEKFKKLALEQAEKIADQGDKDYTLSEINSVIID